MKIKKIILLTSLFLCALSFMAFVKPDAPIPPVQTMKADGGKNFAMFLSHFEKTTLPFQLRLDDLRKYDMLNERKQKTKPKKIKRDTKASLMMTDFIPEINFGRFSRMGTPEAEPIARFYPTEKTVAVIYSLKNQFGGSLNKRYKMMVFDLKGKAVSSSKEIRMGSSFPLAYTSAYETVTCQIDKNGRIWKNTYENVWEKDVRKNGVVDNKLCSFKIKDTNVFSWDENGIIAEMKEIPTNGRASR